MQNTDLRPLGAGEMLDRAITLYVRRFAAIVAVLAVVSIPIVLVQALIAPQSAHVFSDMGRLFTAVGKSATRDATEALARDNQMGPVTILVLFAISLVRVLMWSALVAVLAGAYSGVHTSVADAYRLAMQRWWPLILVSLTYVAFAGLAMVPVIILYVLVLLAIFALAALHATVPVVIVGVAGILLVLGLGGVIGAFVLMTYELSAVAAVTETPNAVQAIGLGMRRAFGKGMKRRTLVGGLVVLLVSQAGAIPLIGIAALASATTHVDALYFAILGAGGVLLDGLVASFVIVFAVDARVRREGLDLILPETSAAPA